MIHKRYWGAFLIDAAGINLRVKHPASCQPAPTDDFAGAGSRHKAGRQHWQEPRYQCSSSMNADGAASKQGVTRLANCLFRALRCLYSSSVRLCLACTIHGTSTILGKRMVGLMMLELP